MRWPRIPWPLAALLAVAALQALTWAIITPPFQGPDEAEHAAYAQHLAETGNSVTRKAGGPGYSTEIETALLSLNLAALRSNASARPALTPLDEEAWKAYQRTMPDEHRKNGVGPNAQAQNPPLYYALQVVPYRLAASGDLFTRLFAMRLLNVLLFVGIVALVWHLAAELFQQRWPRVVAAGAVALQPKLASLAGSVSPDVLLTFVWTAFALVAVRTLRRGPTMRNVALLGALTAASVLTQGRGLALVPAALVLGIVLLVRFRPARATALKLAGVGGGIALAGLVLAALWSASSSGGDGAFGGEITQSAGNPNLREFLSYVWQFYFESFSFLDTRVGPPYGYRQMYVETFFSSLASLEVVFRPRTFDYLQIAIAVGFVVLYTQIVVYRRRLLSRWPVVLVLGSMIASLLVVLHVSAYRDMLINPSQPLITGRYLIPAIALFGITLAFVCSHLPRRVGHIAGALVLAVGVTLSLGSFGVALERFYA